MIFFNDNKNKTFLLVLMTVIFSFFIIYQWLKISPPVFKVFGSQGVASQASSSPESTMDEIKNSLEVSKLKLDELKAAWDLQQKQDELLELTKQKLELVASTTTSTIK